MLNGRAEGVLTRRLGDWDVTIRISGYWQERNYLYHRRTAFAADGGLRQFQGEDAPGETGEIIAAKAKGRLAGRVLTLNAHLRAISSVNG